jgi:hypothetical protein
MDVAPLCDVRAWESAEHRQASMLITEHFFLIACDPATGIPAWPRRHQGAPLLAAAALAMDVALQGRLHLRDGHLRADTSLPLSHPLLNEAVRVLAAENLAVASALRLLAQRLDPLPQKVLDALFRRDLLHRIVRRDWLLRKRARYPVRSMQARNEALQSLQAAARGGDLHGLGLLLLADLSGLLAVHLRAQDHESAAQRLLSLNAVAGTAPEAQHLFAGIRTALLA